MRLRARALAPLGVLALAAVGAGVLLLTAPGVEPGELPSALRAVRVMRAVPRDVGLVVRSQGTVVPRTESELVTEVSGRVVSVSPALVSGGFFQADEVLLRIERSDYEAAVARARASMARAEGDAAHARQELARHTDLFDRGITSQARLDDARRNARVAEAAFEEARINLRQARRDLARTELRASFSGRVRSQSVDVGQFVSRGAPLATLYATDYVEVRLPIPDSELAFLDVPLWQTDDPGGTPGPEVVLHARFAGAEHSWVGQVVRTEGEIDPKSRVVNVVARVEDPYGGSAETGRPPLSVGLFVRAEVTGRVAKGVLEVPRVALRDGNRLLVVDAEHRLQLRPAEVVRVEPERALVRAELAEGDRICVTPLQVVVKGMRVRPVEVSPAEALVARSGP